MTTITLKAIELNARNGHNIALVNGIDVEIVGLEITGSDKQIAWALDIAKSAIASMTMEALANVHENRLWDGTELDAIMLKLNAEFAAYAPKLSGKPARVWIDNKGQGTWTVRAVLKA